ncbi:hypothetical protein [Shimia sp.]|uniref:hypothetical protein n=1 Tax=Shimia sp. TaxID=1954381 RepID=UPI003296ECF3
MALILIFVGSFIGIVVATIQVLFQDATILHGILTYMTFSLGFPFLSGLMIWGLNGLRGSDTEQTEMGFYKA